jgi:hypothetical protein
VSVQLCIEATTLSADTIARVLVTLVEHNIELYAAGEVTRSPFQLRWIPDDYATASVLRDAVVLERRGFGSCGELACAYAAWLAVHHHGPKTLQLLSNGPEAWHVTATRGRTIYDPQVLGRR